jgi:16S rRNA (adenine(1408)-N(1))-methyltransferase
VIAWADRVVVDVGTGDGRALLARAFAEPGALVLGVDASATAMAESSRRADRRGPSNAIFLAAGAEALIHTVLAGRAHLVTVTFPWGSLLRGVLGLDAAALAGIAALVAAGGRFDVLASVRPSDGIDGIAVLDASCEPDIRQAWAAAGLDLLSMRPATTEEVDASGSSWARRLDATRAARPVWRLDLCRPSPRGTLRGWGMSSWSG